MKIMSIRADRRDAFARIREEAEGEAAEKGREGRRESVSGRKRKLVGGEGVAADRPWSKAEVGSLGRRK
ncbi:hypothetical protein RYX36_006890 [Vicia faba]